MFHSIKLLVLAAGLGSFGVIVCSTAPESNIQLHADLVRKCEERIHIQTLENGMRVVCCTADNTNQAIVAVSVDVGFKDETDKLGVAHILEHMMFKGTQTLREGYIDKLALTFGLKNSDYNAYTSFDNTFYFFKTDSQNWQVFGNIVAELLQNLHITPDALDSELGAIIQEIKLRRCDQNKLQLYDLYPYNHPYSHAGIGYKEDILTYTADHIMDFYRNQYTPDKTVFFVVGNVNPDEVFEYARQTFSSFNRRSQKPQKENGAALPFYSGLSATTKTVYHPQLYRQHMYLWQGAPDVASEDAIALSYLASILSARLQQKWINEQGMCVGVHTQTLSLKHAGLFVVAVDPKEAYYTVAFDALLNQEIAALIEHGITDDEYNSVLMQSIQGLVHILENPLALLFELAPFAASPDIKAQALRAAVAQRTVNSDMIVRAAQKYLRPAVMNSEIRLPLPASEWPVWETLQRAVHAHEAQLLEARQRTNAGTMSCDEMSFPQPQPLEQAPELAYEHTMLSNGIELYVNRNTTSDTRVFCLLHKDAARWLLAKHAAGSTGAVSYWGDLVLHGNREYTKKQLDDYCRARGIWLVAGSHHVWCGGLKNTFDEALRLLRLSLDEPLLPQEILDRRKSEFAESLAQSQNDPHYRLSEYLDRTWRSNQPGIFSATELLAQSSATTMSDIQGLIDEMRDPRNVVAVMVGDFNPQEAQSLAEKYFGTLQSDRLSPSHSYAIPPITQTVSGHVEVASENSLVCAVTATCVEDEYDNPALLLLSEHLELQLSNIRERTGLFYSFGAVIKPGTITSLGVLSLNAVAIPGNTARITAEMERLIAALYSTGLTSQEIESLKANRNRMRGTYLHTAHTIAADAVSALEFEKPFNFQQLRDEHIQHVTLEQMNQVIKKYFDPARWSFITVGRSVE
jgi:zinc protease